MSNWPRDNQSALIAFYGTPGPEVERQLVDVIPPFVMRYEGHPIKAIRFHRKAAAALKAALTEIWDHYNHDQAQIDTLGISNYAGAYNPRKIRGSATKWSNHAYGAAIDLNAEANGFGKGHGNIPQPVIDAFKRQGARWGGDYRGRTDPMHFEFCDNGQSAPVTFVSAPQADNDVDQPQQPDDPGVEPDDTQPHAAPANAPKSGITEGAQVVTGAGILGVLSEIWDNIYRVPDAIIQATIHMAQKPTFWLFAGVIGAGSYVWWRRHSMKKAA